MLKSENTTWRVMNCIYDFWEEHVRTPKIREIMRELNNSSTSHVKFHLDKLEDWGYIARERRVSGGIRILKPRLNGVTPGRVIPVRVLGFIAAGEPLPMPDSDSGVFASEQNYVTVDREMLPKGSLDSVYALRVKGHSMIDALIGNGDTIIVKYQPSAEVGETIVARIRDENLTTLKQYYPLGESVELRPANPAFTPIVRRSNEVEIQGKVLLVLRQL